MAYSGPIVYNVAFFLIFLFTPGLVVLDSLILQNVLRDRVQDMSKVPVFEPTQTVICDTTPGQLSTLGHYAI